MTNPTALERLLKEVRVTLETTDGEISLSIQENGENEFEIGLFRTLDRLVRIVEELDQSAKDVIRNSPDIVAKKWMSRTREKCNRIAEGGEG